MTGSQTLRFVAGQEPSAHRHRLIAIGHQGMFALGHLVCRFTKGEVGECHGMAIELPEQPRPAAPSAGLERRTKLRRRPLMHELIDCRLVERSAPGVWTLKGDVQGLLEEEYRTAHEARSDRIFIGLRCEICGAREITSLVDSRRICSSCAQDHDGGLPPGLWPAVG